MSAKGKTPGFATIPLMVRVPLSSSSYFPEITSTSFFLRGMSFIPPESTSLRFTAMVSRLRSSFSLRSTALEVKASSLRPPANSTRVLTELISSPSSYIPGRKTYPLTSILLAYRSRFEPTVSLSPSSRTNVANSELFMVLTSISRPVLRTRFIFSW